MPIEAYFYPLEPSGRCSLSSDGDAKLGDGNDLLWQVTDGTNQVSPALRKVRPPAIPCSVHLWPIGVYHVSWRTHPN